MFPQSYVSGGIMNMTNINGAGDLDHSAGILISPSGRFCLQAGVSIDPSALNCRRKIRWCKVMVPQFRRKALKFRGQST